MTTKTTQYSPQSVEKDIYKRWEESGAFTADNASEKESYVISMPPPNATGKLHVGHAFFLTIQDILIRFKRMQGRETLYLPGTDHAAIATENVVIRKLQKEEGIKNPRKELGREALVERIAQYVEESRGDIRSQIRSMGASCDWTREKYTLEPTLNRCVQEVFTKMYNDGLMYRGNRIVHWDPKLQTNVSDDELEYVEEKGKFYTFQYGPFQISTARPETKFGDKYVVMHPDDKRYAKYKHGDTFTAEWINGPVRATVIKDEAVDPKFGTGVMTITPWHDYVDFEIAQRNNLDKEQVIDFDGKLLPIAGEFAGMPITEAREKVVEKLEKKGLLISTDENYTHSVAVNSRGGGKIEPQIRLQWFVDVNKQAVDWKGEKKSLREVMKDVVVSGDTRILPERFEVVYMQWIDNLRDWCVSRQIWWGHRIPAWYRGEETYVGTTPPSGDGWQQDNDTLDTWFSSALWTWSTLIDTKKAEDKELSLADLLAASPDFAKFHPTSVLETGYDIIFFWVARMILMTTYATGQVPFRDVFLHGLVVGKNGKKMSKSNPELAIDPLVMIDKYGADALRFGLMYQMGYDSQTVKLDEAVIGAGRNFANKLWNISRLLDSLEDREQKTIADAWIQRRFAEVADRVTNSLDAYKFGDAVRELYEFAWHDFADWYMEIIKVEGSTRIAKETFENLLRLLHPFMPFVTEYIWSAGHKDSMLIKASWPQTAKQGNNKANINHVKDIVSTVRSARTLLGISPGAIIDVWCEEAGELREAMQKMARFEFVQEKQEAMKRFPLPSGAHLLIGSEEITPQSIAGAVAKLEKEKSQIEKLIAGQQQTIERMQGKAPEELIEEKKELISTSNIRLQEIETSLKLLQG